MFAPLARLLAGFYALWPSYGFAIAGLTVTILLALLPMTIKQTRAMAEMQRLQPELKRIKTEQRDDRQAQNDAVMALYREHGVNPASGCLPMLVQLPVMIVMYRVIRGLTFHDPTTGALAPRYLDHGSELYGALQRSGGRMVSLGMDLSSTPLAPHGSARAAVPFFVLAGLVLTTSLWQQRLAAGRRAMGGTASDSPAARQPAMMRAMPLLTGVIALSVPAGVGVYYLVSNLFRVGQQHVTRHLHEPATGSEKPGRDRRTVERPRRSPRPRSPRSAGSRAQPRGTRPKRAPRKR